MQFRVILERDGIYRSAEPVGGWMPSAQAGDQEFVVEARDRTEAISKAGKLWVLEPEKEQSMFDKKKKKKKKRAYGY